jgi:hypothetical protein
LDVEKESKKFDASAEVCEGKDLITAEAPKAADSEESRSKSNTKMSPVNDKVVSLQPMNSPNVDEADATRKDVSATVDSLLSSRVHSSSTGVTDMNVDDSPGSGAETDLGGDSRKEVDVTESQEAKSGDTKDIVMPLAAISGSGANAVSEEGDTPMDLEATTEEVEELEDSASMPKEEMKVSWVAMSEASRKSNLLKDASIFIGYDENKTNRAKMLLYTSGSKVHRGRGFERIFGMYWDAICLRLSRPLNGNISKRCDEAISTFLKTRKLRKIHNKFVMSKF